MHCIATVLQLYIVACILCVNIINGNCVFEWGENSALCTHTKDQFRELEHVLHIRIVSDVVAKPEIYSKSRVTYNCWKLSGFIL